MLPKETGIIMSGDHPSKCLKEIKTVTRRTWGLEKINKDPDLWEKPFYDSVTGYWNFWQINTGEVLSAKCHYGGVGDLLIMRETWALVSHTIGAERALVLYKDGGQSLWKPCSEDLFDRLYYGKEDRWRPSIHLPYDFSRGRFEILPGLRPERLEEMSYADAKAEGYISISDYAIGWNSLNAKRGYHWNGNWWIWRIPFKLLE